MIIAHRINTIDELKQLPEEQGIEFDVRDSNGQCIVQHDAFQNGLELDLFLEAVGQRFLIVNIKSEGIEHKVLDLLKKHKLDNFFLLDCSFPAIVKLTKESERRIAIRYSEYESIKTVLAMQGLVEWVWIDCFTSLPFTDESIKLLKESGMKLCLVSPELQGQSEKIQTYIDELCAKSIYIDAVCCKLQNKEHWDNYYSMIKKENGLLIYHQGWTDIVNSLAFIQYFCRLYKKLYILIRYDSTELHSFYTQESSSLHFITIPVDDDYVYIAQGVNMIRENSELNMKEEDMHIIGVNDVNRNNSYTNAFATRYPNVDFWKKFYLVYSIPYTVRVNYFEFKRNFVAEKMLYDRVVKKTPYILTHLHEKTGMQIPDEKKQYFASSECYELHGISSCMFDTIELLTKASEIHLIDSLWAAICYHLDVKYRLLKDIPITVYYLRDYIGMFSDPVSLPNWTFIEN